MYSWLSQILVVHSMSDLHKWVVMVEYRIILVRYMVPRNATRGFNNYVQNDPTKRATKVSDEAKLERERGATPNFIFFIPWTQALEKNTPWVKNNKPLDQ